MSSLLLMSPRVRRIIPVQSSGQFFSRIVLVPQTTAGGTITIAGGAGVGSFSVSQAALPHFGAGTAYVTYGGVDYLVAAYSGGTSVTLIGAPNVTAGAFTIKTQRTYVLILPGSASGATAPYATMMAGHGSGGKGIDGILQMNETRDNVAAAAGWPDQTTGAQLSTSTPFGRDHWPFLTYWPQSAVSNAGTSEMVALYDAIRADVEATYSCDPLRRHAVSLSYSSNVLCGYAAAKASLYASVTILSGVCKQFNFTNFAPGYSGTTDADARTYAAAAFAAAGTAVRHYIGSGDPTPSIQSDFALDRTAFLAAYASAGISSKYDSGIDSTSYGMTGQPWDHAACFRTVNASAAYWADIAAQHR